MSAPSPRMQRSAAAPRPSRLPWLLALTWAAAITYGTLLPWRGWRTVGVSLFAFLAEPWPRYWTVFDVLANVLVYVPLGIALAVALGPRRPPPWRAWLLAALACSALSFGLESLQTLLPGRVPSRVDWLANSLGGLLGALPAAALARRRRERPHGFAGHPPGPTFLHPHGAAIVALVGAWLIAQMAPQRMLFETGAALEPLITMVRDDIEQSADGSVSPEAMALSERVEEVLSAMQVPEDYAPIVETLQIAATLAAVGLLVVDAVALPRLRPFAVGGVLLGGVLIHTVSARWLYDGPEAGYWLSASAQGGLVVGVVLLALLGDGRRPARLATVALLLLAALLLTNMWPGTAYREITPGGQVAALRNVHALLQAIALLWPFAALAAMAMELRPLLARRGPLHRTRL